MTIYKQAFFFLFIFVPSLFLTAQNNSVSLEWISPEQTGTIDVYNPEVTIEAQIMGLAQPQSDKFEVYINGVKLNKNTPNAGGGKFTVVDFPLNPDPKFRFKTTFILPNNEQEVTIGYENVRSSPKRFRYLRKGEKANLYVLSMGPASNLHYTIKDACDFADAFRGQADEGGLYENVYIQTLLGTDATSTRMNSAVETYRRKYDTEKLAQGVPNPQAFKSQDVMIVFISSHGFREKGEYYMIGGDTDKSLQLVSRSINLRNMLDFLDPLPCKKIFFIDACQSATHYSPGFLSGLEEELTRYQNVAVFTSSSEGEKSWEHVKWLQGAFTKAILEGLSGKADKVDEKQGAIDISETFSYMHSYVPALVTTIGVAQHPKLVRNDLGYFNFYVPTLFSQKRKGCSGVVEPGTRSLIGVQISDAKNDRDDETTKRFIDALLQKGYRADFADIKISYKDFSNFIVGNLFIAKTTVEDIEINDTKRKRCEVVLSVKYLDGTGKTCTARDYKTTVTVNDGANDETIKKQALSGIIEKIKKESRLPLCN